MPPASSYNSIRFSSQNYRKNSWKSFRNSKYFRKTARMIADCKKISNDIRARLRQSVAAAHMDIRLAIITARHNDTGIDAQTAAFLKQKRACGNETGIGVREYDVTNVLVSQKALEKRISEIARIMENDAVIVQLPLPALRKPNGAVPVNTQAVVNSIPPKKDADVLHAESCGRYEAGSATALVPPAVGAMEEVVRHEDPDVFNKLEEKTAVAVGQGLVIGKQINRWAIRNNIMAFSGLRKGSAIEHYTRTADIVVSAAGAPGIITPDMIQEGAAVFDFGFSRQNGTVRGDADPAVAERARLVTPVPGGMGPLAVTMLFLNVARIRGVKHLL